MAEEIVNRLKAEGQLIRNTGTNSIRAVRIQLDRFENVFETISEQVIQQTQFLSSMAQISEDQLKINKETQERKAERRARENLSKDQEKETTEKTSKKISLASLAPDSASGFLNTVLKNAMFAGGAFVLSRVFKGFLEERIGETEFTDSLVSAVSWGAIGTLFGKKFGLMLGAGNLLSNALGLPSVVEKIGDALNTELEENDMLTQGIGTAMAGAFLMKGGLKTKLLGGIVVLTNLLGDKVKDWLVEQGNIDPDIANVAVDTASFAMQGAALGSLFGLPGMLAGAVAGLALSLGINALNWFDRQRAEAEAQLKKDLAEAEEILQNKEKRTEVETLRDDLKAMTPEQQSAAIKERGGMTRAEQFALDRVVTPGDYDDEEITYILSEIRRFNQMGSPVPPNYLTDLRNLGYNMENLQDDTGYKIPEFQKGSKGFQDFGSASFAILHGKEAIVPEETPAGRFLEQYFNENWTPKMSSVSDRSSRVDTINSGGSSPVIINNAPTIAPNVNNVGGSTSVNNTNLVGTGSGPNNIDPYGMPRAAN